MPRMSSPWTRLPPAPKRLNERRGQPLQHRLASSLVKFSVSLGYIAMISLLALLYDSGARSARSLKPKGRSRVLLRLFLHTGCVVNGEPSELRCSAHQVMAAPSTCRIVSVT